MLHGSPNLASYSPSKLAHHDDDEQHDDGLFELPSFFVLTFQRYEGETRDGLFHGRGTAKFKGGHSYKGMFFMGVMQGTGVFTWADKVTYEMRYISRQQGEFVHNMPMGQGKYIWSDGSSYEGDVCNGVRHGNGTYKSGNATYKGQWNHSKRHGKGTVYYNQEETSWYKGNWVLNKREGWGIRRYPSGNIYFGEWKHNLRNGDGTMRWLNQGQVYIGNWHDGVQQGHGTHVWLMKRTEPGAEFRPSNQYTGNFFHGYRHGPGIFYYAGGATYEGGWQDNKKHGKVRFVLLRHKTELRSIYRFYSRLGQPQIPGGAFLLSRMQLWRLLKDCYIHHHGVSLAELDLFIRDNPDPAEVHSPFTPIMLSRFLSCLLIIAYHIYHDDMESSNHLLAACFAKLLIDDIFPNAKNVKGFLFKPPERTIVAVDFLVKCWKVYRAYCRVNKAPRDDSTMTNRHILWLYQDLHLYDNDLTIVRVIDIICAETLDPGNRSACMEHEITFLEFFEVLLGCGEVKCQQMTGPYPKIGPSRSSSALARQWQQTLAQDRELDAWSHKIHHFFKRIFFPAVDLLRLF
ncbi:radial spoke head 10 homolog B isoform X4 [Hippocampus zosterae]|uniref:radial spoke head 10 homolog B isoform X4 n=1 Tax=Hippocampus zosterae TaxID=109293 RepID=UPI00223D49A9|nr:radial spoke head 10 homolog B isoform X4 [Hippocampus zosterae]